MHVISRKKLRTFFLDHADSKRTLLIWYSLVSQSDFANVDELRGAFPQVDYVDGLFVFNIGRAYRLIAAIHFNRKRVYVRHILTHREYDRGNWKIK